MKATVMIKTDIDAKFVSVEMAVRYDEEDIPNDFPLRDGDMCRGLINIDEGRIVDWPHGKEGRLQMKVCDQGSYELFDKDRNSLARIDNDYVPNDLIPGEYGDYVDMKIDTEGKITNWNPRGLDNFFEEAA